MLKKQISHWIFSAQKEKNALFDKFNKENLWGGIWIKSC